MANMIYKFEDGLGQGTVVKGGHTLRLHISFWEVGTVGGTDTVKLASEYGMKIKKWGEIEIGDIDERVVNYSEYGFEIYDNDEELRNFLIIPADPKKYNKRALVTLFIKYKGAETYTEKFKGYLDNKDLTDVYDKRTKLFNLTAYPRTDILKQYKLHYEDEINTARNPLAYEIFESSHQGHQLQYMAGEKLIDVLTDIYEKVDADVSLQINHGIKFRGYKSATEYRDFTIEDIYLGIPASVSHLTSLYQFANDSLLMQIFGTGNVFFEIEDLYELLKKLGLSFMFTTGMLTADTAFVKSLYSYDEDNLQTLGKIKEVTEGLAPVEDGIKIRCRRFQKNLNYKPGYDEVIYGTRNTWGTVTTDSPLEFVPRGQDRLGEFTIDEEIITWARKYTSGIQGASGTLFALYNDEPYRIIEASNVSYGEDHYELICGKLQANLLWKYRGLNAHTPHRTIVVEGLDYDFLKNFDYEEIGYQIYKMIWNFDQNKTTIYAIGIVTVDPDEEEQPPNIPLPFFKVMATGWYNKYTFVQGVNYEEVINGKIDMINMPLGFQLQRVQLHMIEAFEGNTDMYIADNDVSNNILVEQNKIVNRDNVLSERWSYKKYETQRTISFHLPGTLTRGKANIFLEILGTTV